MKIIGEKNTYYVRNMSVNFKNIPKSWFDIDTQRKPPTIHFCSDSDICFTDNLIKDGHLSFQRNRSHVHFKKSYVTIVFLFPSNKWGDYTISKLEFILRFPKLMKRMEDMKEF